MVNLHETLIKEDYKVVLISKEFPSIRLSENCLKYNNYENKKVVEDTCSDGQPENFSMNAELTRGIATNAKILGACHWLSTETEGNSLM